MFLFYVIKILQNVWIILRNNAPVLENDPLTQSKKLMVRLAPREGVNKPRIRLFEIENFK